jgi:hypothetical protein
VLAATSELPKVRRSDQALYAYPYQLQSLEPPPNPNRTTPDSMAGQKIFHGEGCSGCDVPPLYTNNKLTLANGFSSRRTGRHHDYKAPSLKRVWYRGHYLHDGSAATLEEMFNPERLSETHVPAGFSLPGVKNRAIKGHEFSLELGAREPSQLIAFLRALRRVRANLRLLS